jgi:hypothetical protein
MMNDDIRCNRITVRGVKTTSAVHPGIEVNMDVCLEFNHYDVV